MKKIILLIIFGFLLAGLILPMASPALAQIGGQNLNACCKIGAKFQALEKKNTDSTPIDVPITWDTKFACVVGELGGQCVIGGTTYVPVAITTTNLPEDTAHKFYSCGSTVVGIIGIDGWGIICLLNTVYIVANWIFYLMMIVVVILFVVAGAKYMMSSGDPEKTKGAKNLMIFGIVGLVVALVAKSVPSVVKLIVAM